MIALSLGFQQHLASASQVIVCDSTYCSAPARFNLTEVVSGLTMTTGGFALLVGLGLLCEDSCDADKKSQGYIALSTGALLVALGAVLRK